MGKFIKSPSDRVENSKEAQVDQSRTSREDCLQLRGNRRKDHLPSPSPDEPADISEAAEDLDLDTDPSS